MLSLFFLNQWGLSFSNYEELPIPKLENQQSEEKSDNIKKLISNENTNTNKSISSDNNNSLEKNILEKIKN